MNSSIKAATLAATLLLATTLVAHAANTAPRGDQMRPGIDPVTTRSIDNVTSPGDPFLPNPDGGNSGPGGNTSPYDLECHGVVNEDGTFTIFLTNTGEVIPKGYAIIIHYPGGEIGLLVSPKFAPGKDDSLTLPDGSFLPPGTEFDCTASVRIKKNPNYDPNVPK